MKPRVVITHWVHPEVVELLSQQCILIPNLTQESLPREEILRRTKDAQAIMGRSNSPMISCRPQRG